MGIEVLKREFDLLWAKVEEAHVEMAFLEFLEKDYNLVEGL